MSAQIIALFTLREALRRRVVLAAALLTFGYLVLYGVGVWFGYRDLQNNAGGPPGLTQAVVSLMLVGGLWSLNFIASMLAVFLSVGALSGEVDQGTLHAIAARPIRRSEIVLGKFVGFVLMLAVFIGVSAAAMILIVAVITGEVVGASWSAPFLMLLASMLLIGLALAGSSRLSPLPNGVIVFTLFATALIGGVIEADRRRARERGDVQHWHFHQRGGSHPCHLGPGQCPIGHWRLRGRVERRTVRRQQPALRLDAPDRGAAPRTHPRLRRPHLRTPRFLASPRMRGPRAGAPITHGY